MTPDTAELRRLAEAATPGPWDVDDMEDLEIWPWKRAIGVGPGDEAVVVLGDEGRADAAYIAAANPPVVLGLLDRIEALEGALKALGGWINGPLADWVERTTGAESIPEPPAVTRP